MSSDPENIGDAGEFRNKANSPLEVIIHVYNSINEWIMRLSSIAILAASCVLTLSVLLRYFLKVPTDWQDEVAVFLLVGCVFMCGAYVQSQRHHVGIEALASILPKGLDKVRMVLVDIASFAFCSFFSWKSWLLFYEAYTGGHTTSSAFAPPLWVPYGLMALGMTNLSLQLIIQILSYFNRKKEPA
ncbi:MAG: TRAP transporter small permease DctQ [Syntrophus sp. SKADARSKE-3]|nr:TRAP transporter small permease DctQ [Syntrophus sp. SKADARSKE-3]